MKFGSANAGYGEADYILAGMPLETTTSHRKGTRFGPNEIRKQSRSLEVYDPVTGRSLEEASIHDIGDLDVWYDPKETTEFQQSRIRGWCEDGKVPVVLGGEHTVTVSGVKGTEPDAVVVFDAHLDLKDEYGGSRYSHASVLRHVHQEGYDVYVIGVREGSRNEYRYSEKEGIELVPADDYILETVEEINKDTGELYLSLDIDALDPSYAPGTGTPVPFGLTSREVRDAVREFAPETVGFDVVEVSPKPDDGNTALLAAQYVKEYVLNREAGR
ncbi:MAG: agmatinase [Halobacteria archaeon]